MNTIESRGILDSVENALQLRDAVRDRYNGLVVVAAQRRVNGDSRESIDVVDAVAMELGSLLGQHSFWYDLEKQIKSMSEQGGKQQ